MVASCVGLDSFAGQTMHQVSKGIRLLLQTLRRACGVHVSGRWRIVVLALGLLATLVVAWLDYVTPQQVSFALAYLIPVVAVAWLARSTLYGMVLAYVCALGQGMVALAAGWHGESEIIVLWNAAVQFVLLAVVVGLLAVVHDLLAEHEQASLTDSLTGLANARALAACGRRELARSERYGGPLALAYFDLDGFKAVNDAAGHQEGDRLLAALGELLGGEVREPDTVARVGGDEFVVLMPQSDAAGWLGDGAAPASCAGRPRSAVGLGPELQRRSGELRPGTALLRGHGGLRRRAHVRGQGGGPRHRALRPTGYDPGARRRPLLERRRAAGLRRSQMGESYGGMPQAL